MLYVFACLFTVGAANAALDHAHQAHIESLPAGRVVAAPWRPMAAEKPAGTLLFIEAPTLKDAYILLTQDPYYKEGRWTRCETQKDLGGFTVIERPPR